MGRLVTRKILAVSFAGAILMPSCTTGQPQPDPADDAIEALVEELVDSPRGSAQEIRALELLAIEMRGHPGPDVLPVEVRPWLAETLAFYVTDLNDALHERDSAMSGRRGLWKGAASNDGLHEVALQLEVIFSELGKDQAATTILFDAQLEYLLDAAETYLSASERDISERIDDLEQLQSTHAEVVTGLLSGSLSDSATVAHVEVLHDALGRQVASVESLVGVAPDYSASDGLLASFQGHGDAPVRQLGNHEQDRLLTELRYSGVVAFQHFASAAVYLWLPLDDPAHDDVLNDLPSELLAAKKDRAPWTLDHWELWYQYVGDSVELTGILSSARESFETRYPDEW